MALMQSIRLGLIGDNIKQSKAPVLHRVAGQLCGLDVSYDRLIPAELGQSFDGVFEHCRLNGYRGINITYPYKEQAVALLHAADPHVTAMGACNTVLFEEAGPRGLNTDYTGFIAAFRAAIPDRTPGIVAMAGAGGVGKAIGFALASLKASALRSFDLDRSKCDALADALAAAAPEMNVSVAETIEEAVDGADGLVNCTPVGMVGYPGTPIPKSLLADQRWACDAVYTPADTEFLMDARSRGLETIGGFELFFHQGIDAFRLFTGCEVDIKALREKLT